ncbi:MAG: hypothetical protein E2P00_01715 [Acidobacteria bacterium]|nr:MAG: hypothetical protein E2P00_01715 [Acidobacteriota bacterium]
MNAPLQDIMAEHNRFQELLEEHQVHLVEGDSKRAALAWERFCRALLAHIQGEEDVILPAYETTCKHERGGEPDVFRREHRRLRRMLTELSAWLAAWAGRTWPATEVILLVEREKTLKDLLEHHDQREDRYLYSALRTALDGNGQSDLLRRFRQAAAETTPGAETTAGSGPARAGQVAAAWLGPIYRQVMEGRVRPRVEAPWAASHERLLELQAALQAGAGTHEEQEILTELAALLDDATPMKNFPAGLARDVHACWQLFHAARRAAGAH